MKRLLWSLVIVALWASPVHGQAVQRLASQAASGTIAANATSVVLPVPVGVGFGTVGVEARGTFTGTIQVECAASTGGGAFVALTLAPRNSATTVTSFTAAGQWSGSIAGCQRVQATSTAWTDGTATITLVGNFTAAGGSAFNGGTFTSPLLGTQSCTAPAYAFTGATTSGFGSSSGNPCVVNAGTSLVSFTAGGVLSTVLFRFAFGTEAAPGMSWNGDGGTGFYRCAENTTCHTNDQVGYSEFVDGGFLLASNGFFGWESGQVGLLTPDVLLSRGAADRMDLASGDSFRVVSGNINIASGEFQSAGNRVNYNLSAYGVGTAYSLTNTAAAIDFGTTDPAIVLDKAGTYQLCGQVNLAYAAATVVAETATIKVRRTNNTAADLSAVVVLDLPVSTTLTHTYGIFQIPCVFYTTAATDDAVTLFANVSAALGAGTINATAIGTAITAVRVY